MLSFFQSLKDQNMRIIIILVASSSCRTDSTYCDMKFKKWFHTKTHDTKSSVPHVYCFDLYCNDYAIVCCR